MRIELYVMSFQIRTSVKDLKMTAYMYVVVLTRMEATIVRASGGRVEMVEKKGVVAFIPEGLFLLVSIYI